MNSPGGCFASVLYVCDSVRSLLPRPLFACPHGHLRKSKMSSMRWCRLLFLVLFLSAFDLLVLLLSIRIDFGTQNVPMLAASDSALATLMMTIYYVLLFSNVNGRSSLSSSSATSISASSSASSTISKATDSQSRCVQLSRSFCLAHPSQRRP